MNKCLSRNALISTSLIIATLGFPPHTLSNLLKVTLWWEPREMFVQHQHGVDYGQHRVRDNQRYSYFSYATITKSFKRGLLMVVRAKERMLILLNKLKEKLFWASSSKSKEEEIHTKRTRSQLARHQMLQSILEQGLIISTQKRGVFRTARRLGIGTRFPGTQGIWNPK